MHIRMDRRGRLPSPRLSLGGALRGGGGGGGVNERRQRQLRAAPGFADVGRAATAGEVLSVRIGLIGDSGDSGGSGGSTVGGSVSSRMSRAASVAFDSPQRPSAAGSRCTPDCRRSRRHRPPPPNSALLASRPTSQRASGGPTAMKAYLWLQRGEFGIKDPNVEIKAQVVDSAGLPVPAALANLEAALSGRGGPPPGEQQFRSRVLHHQARPVWNQIVRLDLSRLLLNAEYQVALEAWHRSSMSQRGERRLGFARRLPLVAVERGVACLSPAGSRIVVFHDSEDAAVAAVAATSPTSTDSRSNLSSLDDRASSGEAGDAVDGRARRPVSNRITVILDFCTGAAGPPAGAWPASCCRCLISARRTDRGAPAGHGGSARPAGVLPRLLASLLPRLSPASATRAFASLVRLLAMAAKQPQQEAARIAACVAETQMPVGLHRVLLRQLATEVHRDFRLATGSQAVMRDLYDSVRPILRLVAASASREASSAPRWCSRSSNSCSPHYASTRSARTTSCSGKFASMLVTDCLPLLVAAGGAPLAVATAAAAADGPSAGQNGRLPLGLLRFTTWWRSTSSGSGRTPGCSWPRAAADHAIEVLIAQKVKIEEQASAAGQPGHAGVHHRPLNELLRRLGLLDAATSRRCAGCRFRAARAAGVCALVAFDRPVANMRLPQKPQEPKYLRWILTSIVSLMELFNRSEGAWHDWLEAADGASADAAAAACASWSPVLGLEVWPSLPAARTDLVDEAAEMLLQFLSGIFDQYAAAAGAWNGLLLLESAVTMETMRRLAALLPLESLPSLAGAALSSLFSFIQQPQALASMGERRRHPRLAALPPDLRQPALETAALNFGRGCRTDARRFGAEPGAEAAALRGCGEAKSAGAAERAAVGMLADLLQIPDSAHASATQLTLALDKLMEEQRADEGFSARFRRQLAQALDEATGAPGSQLVCPRERAAQPAAGERARPSGSAGSAAELADDPQALALHRLQRFYQEAGLHQLAWRCCLRLWQLQQRAGRLIEAACCLASAPPDGQREISRRRPPAEGQAADGRAVAAPEGPVAGVQARERAVLLRLSGLCQELQSPNLSDWRRPAPAYYLAALRSGAEAELPAGLRRAAGAQTRRVTSSALPGRCAD
uniref:C2 domain-containing protein n=1 Tax=Macrostomum lignano TaxID=282301 RepID=A0A1I8FTV4_9PLAT